MQPPDTLQPPPAVPADDRADERVDERAADAEPIERAAEVGEPAAAAPAPEPVTALPGAVDVRSVSLLIIAVLGSVFMMHWAAAVLVPLMLGVTLSYALGPVVNRLERHSVPRALAAALVVMSTVAAVGAGAYSVADDATQFIEALPQVAQKLRKAVREQSRQSDTPIEKVQQAATQIEQAAKESARAPAVNRGVTRVQIEKPAFVLQDYLLSVTPRLLALAGQTMVVIFITYFLLASGNHFRRKMVHLAGPRLAQKKLTLQALDEITEQIQRYLMIQVLISVIVGVATWLAFWAMGIEHAEVWGVLGFLLNLVPYIGALVFAGAAAVAAFLQFGSFDMVLLTVGVSTVLHTISGNWLMPWLTGRTNRMNPVAVFVGLLVFGWLWGVAGLVLGVPVLLIVKTVSEHVEDLRAVAEMLSA